MVNFRTDGTISGTSAHRESIISRFKLIIMSTDLFGGVNKMTRDVKERGQEVQF